MDADAGIVVVKRDGSIRGFDRSKLVESVARSLAEAGIDPAEAEGVIGEALASLPRRRVTTRELRDAVERALLARAPLDPRYGEAAKLYLLARIYDEVHGKDAWEIYSEVDMGFTYQALKVLAARYLARDPETGRLLETPEAMLRRVARSIASVEARYGGDPSRWEEEFYRLMASRKFLPNSPTLMNAGTKLGILSACFVIPVRDALVTPDGEGIMDAVRAQAIIMQAGGGVGADFSEIRPEGDVVKSSGGRASGPLSFLKLFDVNTEVIKQGGRRRGANMGVLHAWHPDIEKFIGAKTGRLKDVHLQNFNISVGLYDEFLRAVLEGREWPLVNPRKTDLRGGGDSRYYAVVRARNYLSEPWVQEVIIRELEERGGAVPLDESVIVTVDEALAVAEHEGAVAGRVPAADLWRRIVEGAWDSGDPGALFIDEMNRRHPVWYLGKIQATNPCVSGDTKVLTPDGWVAAEKLYEEAVRHGEVNAVVVDEEVLGPGGDKVAFATKLVVPGPVVAASPDGKSRLRAALVVDAWVWRVGEKRGIRIETKRGHAVTVTPEHRLLTPEGWREAWEILPGHEIVVAVPSERHPGFLEETVDVVDKVRYAGHVMFYDFTVPGINTYLAGGLVHHNCGEQPLLPWESCNLGSINLERYVVETAEGPAVDWEALGRDVETAVRFLDDVIDAARWPLPQLEEAAKRTRKIGLGVMGFAHMLARLGVPYDSPDAVAIGYAVAEYILYRAALASARLAAERGPFPAYDPGRYRPTWRTARRLEELLGEAGVPEPGGAARRILASRPPVDWGLVEEEVRRHGLRNAALTSIAPTGTISIIAGTSSSIEPIFAVAFVRRVSVGEFTEVDPLFLEALEERGLLRPDVVERVAATGRARGAGLPGDLERLFPTALDVPVEYHVLHQAAWQQWVCAAVSKTINLPHDASVGDVERAFLLAWRLGCKGITVYRDRSKGQQVINYGLAAKKKRFRLDLSRDAAQVFKSDPCPTCHV